MLNYILVVLLILVLILLLVILKKKKQKKALLLMQQRSKEITDDAFFYVIQKISFLNLNQIKRKQIKSDLVSDIWGSRVTAFEYSMDVQDIKTTDLEEIKADFQMELDKYAEMKHLDQFEGNRVFVVSDIWIFSNVLHIDISHITNQSTLSYIKDVKKSDNIK